jgi:precorrin-4 methylase
LRVLSGDPACYGAATSQILAIYENFQAFAVSVLLLANSLF